MLVYPKQDDIPMRHAPQALDRTRPFAWGTQRLLVPCANDVKSVASAVSAPCNHFYHILLKYSHDLRTSQACSHCHVESSPDRVEMADRAVAERCIKVRVAWWYASPSRPVESTFDILRFWCCCEVTTAYRREEYQFVSFSISNERWNPSPPWCERRGAAHEH